MRTVYLDNNATTMVAPEVLEEMLPYFSEQYGNPSSIHSFGGNVGKKLNEARHRIADGLGCQPSEILFTACGTEGDNTALHSALESQPDKRHIITTKVEHPAILNTVQHLEQNGYSATYLSVGKDGALDLDELRDSIRDDTALVSIMYANNESGVIFPIPKIAEIVKEHGVFMHTDAVQAVGKVPFKLSEVPVDFLVMSGHKIHAPKGVAAMYIRKGTPFRPYMLGGHQERGRRAGTENTTGIIGLGKAVELSMANIENENTVVKAKRDRLQRELMARIPDAIINGDTQPRLPNTLSIAFKYIEGEAMLLHLDRHGICASSGSACTSGSLEPSHVLRAMGVPFTFAHGSLRFSLSRYTTDEDIDLVVDVLPGIIENLRAMSPFSRRNEGVKPDCTC